MMAVKAIRAQNGIGLSEAAPSPRSDPAVAVTFAGVASGCHQARVGAVLMRRFRRAPGPAPSTPAPGRDEPDAPPGGSARSDARRRRPTAGVARPGVADARGGGGLRSRSSSRRYDMRDAGP